MNRPTTSDSETAKAVRAAAIVFGAMIAFQMAGKATQGALFLSTFDVRSLPTAIMGAAALTIVAVIATSGLMSRFGPGRVVSSMFVASGVLQLLEWRLFAARPAFTAVVVYLHYSALGALLISGYWSVINERFDPRTLKRAMGSIGKAGAVGGLLGGLTAFTSAAALPVSAMLPILAAVHLFCGFTLRRVLPGVSGVQPAPAPAPPMPVSIRALTATGYLRTLVAVVLLATIAEGLIDFVFKAQARAAFAGGPELLRLFALFYVSAGVLSFVVQSGLSSRALERLGLARTAAALPWTIVLGSAGALLLPGLSSAMFARGAEMVARNTLYRSAYELLFTPMRAADKRAIKPMIDVGVVRLGDAFAAGIVKLVIVTTTAGLPLLLVLAIASAAAGIALTIALHGGYVATLERSLLSRAVHLNLEDITDSTTRTTMMRTIAGISPGRAVERMSSTAAAHLAASDSEETRIDRLRSRDAERVRAALSEGPLEESMVPIVIGLLAWDDVAADALKTLQANAPLCTGVLVASLVDPAEDFTVRRRIPSALMRVPSAQSIEGLLGGLNDSRFEVRFRCGRALARLLPENPSFAVEPDRVIAAVLREVAVERRIWESQRLLDSIEDEDLESGFIDQALRNRASRSLEHVFTLLSLVLPARPLRIAFHGLYARDAQLRGTALEYLEITLPEVVRERLWPFLDDRPHRTAATRPHEEVVAALLASTDSILLNLDSAARARTD